jgi:predicted lipoprotein with Yx(FWY)xxD motif
MKKRLQSGFALTETVLVLVLVGLVSFVVWYVFHTKSDTNATLGNAANTQTEVSKNTKQPSSTSQSSTASQIVVTKTDSKGNKYLADGNDKTLYTYGADTNGVSNCTGSCLTDWPIYKATSTTSLPANVTIITRSDGGTQYAYKGLPLYYFTGDTTANNFHVAKP